MTKTKLVKIETGEPIRFRLALLRLILALVAPPFGIGCLRSLRDPKRQTVADKIVKAVVVRIDDASAWEGGTGPQPRNP